LANEENNLKMMLKISF